MLWKYLIIYLATESCQTVSCNSSCTSRRSSFFLGGLLRGRFQGWNRSQWWVVHRGGLRVDGAVPRVAVHNGPVGSCSSTVAGATQFGAPYAGALKEIVQYPAHIVFVWKVDGLGRLLQSNLANLGKSKWCVDLGNTGCAHRILCVRGLLAFRIGTEVALRGETLFGHP